jgi:hypothetical protein
LTSYKIYKGIFVPDTVAGCKNFTIIDTVIKVNHVVTYKPQQILEK